MERDVSEPWIPAREARGHKGTFGTVAVIGGCARRPDGEGADGSYMVGGPALAATAALRAGAGLVRLVLPEPVLAAGLAIAPSATGVPLAVDDEGDVVPHLASAAIDGVLSASRCAAVGPGLGVSRGASAMVMRCVAQDGVPLVLDADALNNLAGMVEFHRDFRAPAVITPHVGEFRRLAAAMGVRGDEAGEESCGALARRVGCVVVLKSATTVVSDGQRAWVHDRPNPVLATAGTGDVLCGVVAGLVAQFGAGGSLYECARAAVRVHALAAEAWVARRGASAGMLAGELLEEVPGAMERLRG